MTTDAVIQRVAMYCLFLGIDNASDVETLANRILTTSNPTASNYIAGAPWSWDDMLFETDSEVGNPAHYPQPPAVDEEGNPIIPLDVYCPKEIEPGMLVTAGTVDIGSARFSPYYPIDGRYALWPQVLQLTYWEGPGYGKINAFEFFGTVEIPHNGLSLFCHTIENPIDGDFIAYRDVQLTGVIEDPGYKFHWLCCPRTVWQ